MLSEQFLVRGFCPSVDFWIKASRQEQIVEIFPSIKVECYQFRGIRKLETLQTYITSAETVSVLPNASTRRNTGAIVSVDGQLFLDRLSRFAVPPLNHPPWNSGRERLKVLDLDGRIVVVTHHGPQNFFHMLANCLSRIWLVQQSGLSPDALITVSGREPWCRELLQLASISETPTANADGDSIIIACDLIIPFASGYSLGVASWVHTAITDLLPTISESRNDRLRL
jgi:hypothetical protein